MMTSLLDAVADWIGRGLQRFGVKRGALQIKDLHDGLAVLCDRGCWRIEVSRLG